MDNQSVLSNVVIACLIGSMAMAVGWRGRRAALAHILWIGFFLKLVTPPIWQVRLPVLPSVQLPWDLVLPTEFWTWLFIVWLSGFLLLVIRGSIANLRFAQLLKREGRLDPEATAFVTSLLGKGRSGPPVVRLPVRLSPMLFGSLFSPKIVCPDELWGLLNDDQRHAFLAHETAHYYRRDHWVRWLEWLVTAVYWWFPGVYFGRGQLERHEEACCDAWAVNRLGTTPRTYAETLLSVVDFVSEHDSRLPRLANGMQPTYTLEERLRLLMRPPANSRPSSTLACSALSVCSALLLLHPLLDVKPFSSNNNLANGLLDRKESSGPLYNESNLSGASPFQWPNENQLPESPKGFWNRKVEPKWADFTLQLGNARVRAEAGKGITIVPTVGEPLHFSTDELVALAEIPSSGRIVIGDSQGRLRLWDLEAGAPVSLIGQHNRPITSLTYHQRFGLISADGSGQVIRWDLDSGLRLAGNSVHRPVQSVRISMDGKQLAVMTGCWHNPDAEETVWILDSNSLERIERYEIPNSTATIVQLAVSSEGEALTQNTTNWFTIDWRGQVRSTDNATSVFGQIDKQLVSSLVFTQQILLSQQIAPPPPLPVSVEPTELIYVEP